MKTKHNRTHKRDAAFFAAIADGLPPGEAAKEAGYTRVLVVEWQGTDPAFAKSWCNADDEAVERLEAEADRRAVKGTERPIYFGGKKRGSVREYSDALLIFRLKAKRPDVYRERSDRAPRSGPPRTVVIKNF